MSWRDADGNGNGTPQPPRQDEAPDAAQAQASLLVDAVDRLPGMLAHWDTGKRCTFANRMFLEWYGLAPEQAVGMHLRDVIGPEAYARVNPHAEAALLGVRQVFERTLTTVDGEVIHVLTVLSPNVRGGRVVGVFGAVTDITAVKQVQMELVELNLRLVAAQRETRRARDVAERDRVKFQALFDQSPDAVLLVDQAGRVREANVQAAVLFGAEDGALVGAPFAELAPQGPAESSWSFVARTDGSTVPVAVRSGPLVPGLDGPRIITARDMSEESSRQAALERSNAELEQFTNAASHDLQEPLVKVSAYLSLLSQDYTERLDDDGRRFLAIAIDGATRMRVLIQDLLAVSKIRLETMGTAECDTGELVADVLAGLETVITETGAQVSVGDLPRILGDRAHLRQVFHNLLSNALKYRSDRPPAIEISAVQDRQTWRFAVKDNGIGFKQEYAAQVFEMFQRLVTRNEYEGTGIGLALVAKVIHNHGGTIWATSEPGVGTTFEFTLPAGR